MYRCQNCSKGFSRKNNMKRHQIQTCKGHEQKDVVGGIINNNPVKVPILGDIINKVVQGSDDMSIKPTTKKAPSSNKPTVVPIAVNNKPKSLTANESEESKSDSETESDDFEEISEDISESSDPDEFMEDNSEELKESFRNLFTKLHHNIHHNIDIYNKLVLILDELEVMDCLKKEECKAINKLLQEKIGI